MADLADITRVVETRFMLKDELSDKLGKINESLTKLHASEKKSQEESAKLSEKFEQIGSAAESAHSKLEGMAAAFGVAIGGFELAKRFVDANSEAENLTRTLGALVSANYQYGKMDPTENLKRSLQTGREMLDEFDEAAIKNGLVKGQLADAASMLMPGFAAAKVGSEEVTQQVVKLGLISRSAGRDLGQTSASLEMFLTTGMAMKRNPVMQLLGLQSMEHSTAAQRFDAIQKGLSRFNTDALKGVVTFDDRVNMLKARLEKLYEKGGEPLFKVATEQAEKIAQWLDKNQAYVERIARDVADKFATGLNIAVRLLQFAAEHADAIKAAFIAIVATQKITGFFDKLNDSLKNFAATTKEGSGLAAKFGETAGKAANVAMVAEAFTVGYAIGTAINGYLEKQPWWNKLWSPSESDAEKSAGKALSGKQAEEKLRRDEVYKLIQDFANINHMSLKEAAENRIKYLADRGTKAGLGHGLEASAEFIRLVAQERGILAAPVARPTAVDKERARVNRGDTNFYNARFDIKQNFAEGMDPDRIAVAMKNEISTLGERRLQSGLAPVGGVR